MSMGMNIELKLLIAMIFDLVNVAQNAITKKDFVTGQLPGLYKVASDIPGVVANFADLPAEFKVLPGSAQEADLVSFILASFEGVTGDAHAKAILNAALKLAGNVALDSVALAAAIKG